MIILRVLHARGVSETTAAEESRTADTSRDSRDSYSQHYLLVGVDGVPIGS